MVDKLVDNTFRMIMNIIPCSVNYIIKKTGCTIKGLNSIKVPIVFELTNKISLKRNLKSTSTFFRESNCTPLLMAKTVVLCRTDHH